MGLAIGLVRKQNNAPHNGLHVAPTSDRVGHKVQKAAGAGSSPRARQAVHLRVAAVHDRQHCRVPGASVAAGHGLAEGGHEGCVAPDEGEGGIGSRDAGGLEFCRHGAMTLLEQLGAADWLALSSAGKYRRLRRCKTLPAC